MAGERVVAVGFGAEFEQNLRAWGDELDLAFDRVGFEPPCELPWVRSARLVLINGSEDPLLGVAECGRLRAAERPMVLVAGNAAAVEVAASRSGAAAVLQGPVTRSDIEDCLTSYGLLPRPTSHSGRRPLGRCTQLTPSAVMVRDARTLWVDGAEVSISAQKFDLLCHLVDRAGTAVCAADLVRAGLLRPSQAQRYKGLIQELKRHLGPARDLIRAVPGYGYRLDWARDDDAARPANTRSAS